MRLITRSDFDGICCAVLLFELGIVDEMVYAHPRDLQAGDVKVTSNDVLANVPYVEGCGLWFDHHSSESERLEVEGEFKGRIELAPSAARVIARYYDSDKLARFEDLLINVDKVDSAQLTAEEVMDPADWVLLGFLCDPRSGLGYHKDFRISNLQLMQELVGHLRTKSIKEVLEVPDVKERVDMYWKANERFMHFLLACSTVDGPMVVSDTRGRGPVPPGNRFLIYSLFPDAEVDVRLIDGRNNEFISISVGHSIINRGSKVDVGSMLLGYGGGGHKVVGTCQVPYADGDRVLDEIKAKIKAAG